MNMNPQQFENVPLPGMGNVEPREPGRKVASKFAEHYESKWSGPIPGQTVMGVHDLGGDSHRKETYTTDRHGMVAEMYLGRGVNASPEAHVNDQKLARDLYRTAGGTRSGWPAVEKHWDSMPLHQIPSDTPVHTGQNANETSDRGSSTVKIRTSIQNGEQIQKPAWLMKKAGRLYALDGHHRIQSAREEGHASYPARVWDYDKYGEMKT